MVLLEQQRQQPRLQLVDDREDEIAREEPAEDLTQAARGIGERACPVGRLFPLGEDFRRRVDAGDQNFIPTVTSQLKPG